MNTHHLSEETLTALIFDEADAQAQRHLSECALCQARMRELAEFYHVATHKLYRVLCPSPDALIRYLEGRLPSVQAQQVKAHLAQCTLCQEEVAELRIYVQSANEAQDTESSRTWWAAVEDGIRRLFQAQPLHTPNLQPVRGDGPQLLHYHTPEFDILLSLLPAAPGAFDLIGQITPLTEARIHIQGRVRIDPTPDATRSFLIDDTGGFQIDRLSAGAHHLLIELDPDVLIELDLPLLN